MENMYIVHSKSGTCMFDKTMKQLMLQFGKAMPLGSNEIHLSPFLQFCQLLWQLKESLKSELGIGGILKFVSKWCIYLYCSPKDMTPIASIIPNLNFLLEEIKWYSSLYLTSVH